jgi:hypothetical protein
LENHEFADQQQHPAILRICTAPDLFARQGHVDVRWRGAYGPYYLLRYRHQGREQSIYLGRDGPLVELVRALLERLQAPARRRRAQARSRRQIMAIVRASNTNLSLHLAALGLRMNGLQTRGWRQLPGLLANDATAAPAPQNTHSRRTSGGL